MAAKSFKEYEKLIAGKSMRERVLIAAGVAVLIAWPVYFSIIDSNASAEKKAMADILKKMLSTSGDIEVLSMENLPPKVLIQDEGEVNLFQHTVRVTFKGKYLDIMDHLKKIEKMNYKFYWHSIDYHVVKHPYSEVTIEVYTLSINKDFLHV